MSELGLLLASVLCYTFGALLCLMCARCERLSINISALTGALGAIAGLAASIPVLLSGQTLVYAATGPFAFAHFVVRFDQFAALMVLVISLLVLATSVYSKSYVEEYLGRGAWAMGFFMNLFIAAMVALVVSDNALYFLIFFEKLIIYHQIV